MQMLVKTPGLFERGPGKGMIALTDMQGMADDGQMRPEELIVAGWYNIYLIYDLEIGVFDVCAALSECMTDPTFLLKETDARGISQKNAARFIGIAYLHPSDALGNKMHFARFIQQDGVFSFTPPDDSRRESQYPTFKVKGIELLPQSHRGRLDNFLLERSLMKNKDFAKAESKLNPDKSWLDWLGYKTSKVNNVVDGIWNNLTESLFSAEYDYNQKDFRADPVTIFTSGFFPSLAVGTAIVEGDYTLSIPVNRMNQRQDHFVPTSAQIASFNSYSHKDTWDKTDRFKCVAKPGVSAGFDESLSVITCSNRFYIPSTDTKAVTLHVDDIPFSAAYDPNEPPPDIVGSAIAGSNFYDLSISATLLMDIKRIRMDLSQFGPMISAALQTRVNQPEFALFDNNAPIVSLDDTESPGSLEAF